MSVDTTGTIDAHSPPEDLAANVTAADPAPGDVDVAELVVRIDAGFGVIGHDPIDAIGGGRHHFFTSSAFRGVGAPACCGAFSSPGSVYTAPSQGLSKSNVRISCASFTGR